MIGAIMSAINLTCEAKTWKTWLDYILKKQKQYNFKKVALYHSRGNLLAATSGFRLSENDIKVIIKFCYHAVVHMGYLAAIFHWGTHNGVYFQFRVLATYYFCC